MVRLVVLALVLHVAPARADDGWVFGLHAGFTKVALEGYDLIDGTGPALRVEVGHFVRPGVALVAYGGYGQVTSTEWLDPGEGDYNVEQLELGGELEVHASRLIFAVGGGLAVQHEAYSYDEGGEGVNSAGARWQRGPVVELRIGIDVMQTARWHAQLIATVKQMDLWGTSVPDGGQMRTNESGTGSTLALGLQWR